MPGRPNGNALAHLRTNEIALGGGGRVGAARVPARRQRACCGPSTIDLTPDLRFDNTELLAEFVRENEASILVERHDGAADLPEQAFQGGAVFNNLSHLGRCRG